jgi:hypothetical protein
MLFIGICNSFNIFRSRTIDRASDQLPLQPARRLRAMQHAAYRAVAPVGLVMLPASAIFSIAGGGIGYAQQATPESLAALQNSIAAQEAKLNQEELQLEQQSLELNQQQHLLDTEMATLRGTGSSGAGETTVAASATPAASAAPSDNSVPAAQPASPGESSTGAVGEEQQQQQQQNQQEQTKVILQAAPTLANSGGILTPKGQFIIDPSLEYDYWSQNQLQLNGFTIIPGITFGNLFISRVEQNFLTAAVTARYGVTDRLEVNIKLPYVVARGSLTAQEATESAQPLYVSQDGAHIGDIQLGASYQFNSGENGWPVFVGNLLFKTTTGQNPYEVPIYTVNDPNGQFLEGIPKKLPTGTGFYSLEPSVTVFYATAPGVLFGNIQYIKNFSSTFDVSNPGGGPPNRENLEPGSAVAGTFGLGFALNDKASMTFSYEEEYVFGASANDHAIVGSAYGFGTFNFGLGYTISARTSVNIGVGIGAGPNAPAAKILVEVPMRF